MEVYSGTMAFVMPSRNKLGNWGDVDVEVGGLTIGPIAMVVLALALVSVVLIIVGLGANQPSQYFDFQTGQAVSNFGNSVAGVGYGILALLAIGFVTVIVVWAWSQSNSGSEYGY